MRPLSFLGYFAFAMEENNPKCSKYVDVKYKYSRSGEIVFFPSFFWGGRVRWGVYRQSETFEGSWPSWTLLEENPVPYSRVDWYDHSQPWSHHLVHQHVFYFDDFWQKPDGSDIPFEWNKKW